jgi:TRAP-type mannitol/chloroaromatic compound transport system permease small subunit
MSRALQRALRLSNAIDRASLALGHVVAWLVLAMVAIGAYNAVGRYVGRFVHWNLSSNVYIELQWVLFGVVFLLGAASTLASDGHVRVDVFYGRLSARARARIDLAGALVLLLPFCGLGVVASWPTVVSSWALLEGSPDPGGLPRYPIKTLIPFAFAWLGVQGGAQAIKSFAVLRGARPADPPRHGGSA